LEDLVDSEMADYKAALASVGTAVAHANDCRAKLHTAVEAASDQIGKQVASDTAAKTV
jgi:hypothetical protein